jgi:hypothetical protein
MPERIERLGTRSWEELADLLQEGYFVSGERRITKDVLPNSARTDCRLWDNWREHQFHLGANNLRDLVFLASIPIEEWAWVPNEPVPQQTGRKAYA